MWAASETPDTALSRARFRAGQPGVAKSRCGREKFGAFQLVVSFQNVLNHPNLGDPVAGSGTGTVIVANANAGRITATHSFPVAGSPRTGQVDSGGCSNKLPRILHQHSQPGRLPGL